MRTRNSLFYTLGLTGIYFAWRNRFAIQQQLERMGFKTPIFRGDLGEAAQSIASKVKGRFQRGATIAEHKLNRTEGRTESPTESFTENLDEGRMSTGTDRKVSSY